MYLKYFADYDDSLPVIAGFVDCSYGNDTCPSIYSASLGITIYCDYANPAKRECCGERYSVSNDNGEILLSTDNLQVVRDLIAAKS